MHPNLQPDHASDVPWPTSEPQVPVPNTSMLPDSGNDSDKAPLPAGGLLQDTLQGAHATIDRLADSAMPAMQQLGDSVSAAAESLNVKADQLRETRDAWVEEARSTVRSNPLAAVAAAVAVGVVIARLTR